MSEIKFISGTGKPRLMIILDKPGGVIYTSEAGSQGILQCASRHRLVTGRKVRISDHSNSNPDINGDHVITKIDEYRFSIPVAITVGGTGGGFQALTQIYESIGATTFDETHAYEAAGTFPFVKTNHRVVSYRVAGDFKYTTFGKVVEKNVSGEYLKVDAWTNGTPTNGQKIIIDGWIADLPRCQAMTEMFEPDTLIHSLYNGDEGSIEETKFRGYKYECELDYSEYTSADMLIDLSSILNGGPNDKVILVPRRDVPGFNYEVYLKNKFSLTRHRSKGYKKPVFLFRSKSNVQCYAVKDGVGFNCGFNFGTNW